MRPLEAQEGSERTQLPDTHQNLAAQRHRPASPNLNGLQHRPATRLFEASNRFESSLKQAARLVENAARGRFPSFADLTDAWTLVRAMRPQLHVVLRSEMRRLYSELRRQHEEEYPDIPFQLSVTNGPDVVAVAALCGDTYEEVKRIAPGLTEYEFERQLRNRERLRRLQAEIPLEMQERLKQAGPRPSES